MWELTLNIHKLLTIRIHSASIKEPTRDLKYSNFISNENLNEPDIILNIGSFAPSTEGTVTIAHRYFIKENYFYCNDIGEKSHWEIEIFGLEKDKTIINFNGKHPGLKGFLFPSFLAQEFLIPLIEYKLIQKNCYLIHGGGVVNNEEGHIFIGRPGVWKTSIILDLIRTGNYQYLGDDRIIITGNGEILSFPTSLFLFDFCLINNIDEKRRLRDEIKLLFHILMRKKVSFSPLRDCKKIKTITFVSRKNNNEIKLDCLDLQVALQKILTNNMAEYEESKKRSPNGQFMTYVQIYSLIFPNNNLKNH